MSSRPSQFVLTQPGQVRLYSAAELIKMPPPEWLIDPIMPEGGMVGLYGPPGAGKSFLAIDMAMSVATGRPWQGRPTQKGLVVYISAEGGAGIGKRVLAWLRHNNVEAKDANIAFLIESLPMTEDSEGVAILLKRLIEELEQKPALIVVDTLARCFDGDENQQEDMNRFVAGVDLLRKELGCTVVIVHHTRLEADRERGNTAFRGAADTMIAVSIAAHNEFTVSCNKQKDAEAFDELAFKLVSVEDTASCVLESTRLASAVRSEQAGWAFSVLKDLQPAEWDTWKDKVNLSPSQFQKAFNLLRSQKRIEKTPEGWGVVKGEETHN